MSRRVALTGASGLIGSHAARALAAAGHPVRALVRHTSRRDCIRDVVDEWVVGGLADAEAINRLVSGVDVVIHCALDWDLHATDELPDIERNVMGSLRLLEAARLADVHQFIFVSSAAAAAAAPVGADGCITEAAAAWPLCPYGAYKASVEAYLKAYHARYRMNTSAWRPAAVYGMHPSVERSLWFDLVQRCQRGELVDEPRTGRVTHVQDVADALALAVGDERVAGEVYNLAELHLAWQTVGEVAKLLSGSSTVRVEHRSAEPQFCVDTSKALAFFARRANHTGLRRGMGGVQAYVQALLSRATT